MLINTVKIKKSEEKSYKLQGFLLQTATSMLNLNDIRLNMPSK